MTRAEFCAAIRQATAPGHMDIVRLIVPQDVDGLPTRVLVEEALHAYRNPDVIGVVLMKPGPGPCAAVEAEGVTC